MEYTPRQLAAYVAICEHRKRRELRDQLHIGTLAARGDTKALKATIKDLDQ